MKRGVGGRRKVAEDEGKTQDGQQTLLKLLLRPPGAFLQLLHSLLDALTSPELLRLLHEIKDVGRGNEGVLRSLLEGIEERLQRIEARLGIDELNHPVSAEVVADIRKQAENAKPGEEHGKRPLVIK